MSFDHVITYLVSDPKSVISIRSVHRKIIFKS